MLELVMAGGWLMLPILACSVVSVAIIIERFWTLQTNRIVPKNLANQAWRWAKENGVTDQRVQALQKNSPLGQILAVGLLNRNQPHEVMKDSIEESGRHVAHKLERFLNTLGTIAAITPLLGLLGTVVGMIDVFAAITSAGIGNPSELAAGISQALITTAAGMSVAIPSLMFYRYFRGRVDELIVGMEQEALKLAEAIKYNRQNAPNA